MKTTSSYFTILLLSTFVLDVDKDLLTVFLASGVATLFRLMYEKTHNELELSAYRIFMIVLVSLFLPYGTYNLIKSIDFLANIKLVSLFVVGILAIDIAEKIIKNTPKKIEELINLLPTVFKRYVGMGNESDNTKNKRK